MPNGADAAVTRSPIVLPAPVGTMATVLAGWLVLQVPPRIASLDYRPLPCAAAYGALAAIAALLVYGKRRFEVRASTAYAKAECVLFAAIVVAQVAVIVSRFPDFVSRPMIDIGGTTEAAAVTLFRDHANPYTAHYTPDFGLTIRPMTGYRYGPFMILAYGIAAALQGGVGVRLMNVLFFTGAAATVALLADDPKASRPSRIGSALFCAGMTLGSRLVQRQLFIGGINDVLPTLLVLVSLAFARRGRWGWAGGAAGLALSAKFAPAIFFFVGFARRDLRPRFLAGAAVGSLTMLPFLLWAPWAFLHRVFLAQVEKRADATSLTATALYASMPGTAAMLLLALKIAGVALVVAIFARRRLEPRELLVPYFILGAVAQATYAQMHFNHLLWFLTPLAVLVAWRRSGQLPIAPEAGKGAGSSQSG